MRINRDKKCTWNKKIVNQMEKVGTEKKIDYTVKQMGISKDKKSR